MRKKNIWLKVMMMERDLLQADVAYKIGISESRLSRIVNGRAVPEPFEVVGLSEVLDVHDLPEFNT
jgi:DNA-binding Xre family transcriptional regulator